ncbi:Ribonuclease H-like domain [Trinorchestia longiramus]|nr:Ribonuclease H-like domain [Trinorchestia longiramus]
MECQLGLLSSILEKSSKPPPNTSNQLDEETYNNEKNGSIVHKDNSVPEATHTSSQKSSVFSLVKSGLEASAHNQERQPLLLSDMCPLLASVVLAKERNIDDKCWYKIKKSSVSRVVLVIAEGLSVHHLCHLRCSQVPPVDHKKSPKRRKLDFRCQCVEGCAAACTEPLNERLLAALPRLSAMQSVAVETVPPALYGRRVLQDLFQLRCSEMFIKNLASDETATAPASLSKDLPSSVLYKSAVGVQQDTVKRKAEHTSTALMEEFWLAQQNVKLNYYKTLEYNFTSKLPSSKSFWSKGKSANLLPPDKFDRRLLLLSLREMLRQQYPMPQSLHDLYSEPPTDASLRLPFNYSSFIPTKTVYAPVTASSPIFGVDCEFNNQKQPVLIAVVNESGELVYRTPILWGRCEGDDRGQSLLQVQRALCERLPPDAILVGHSFNVDLKALQLYHPYVIDSFYLFDLGTEGALSHSLRHLARLFLQKEVQLCKHEYHDPGEDALTSLQLLQLKLSKGVTFGVKKLGGFVPCVRADFMETSDDQCYFQNFFEVLSEKSAVTPMVRAQVVTTSSEAWGVQLGQFSAAAVLHEAASETGALCKLIELGACESPLVVAHFMCKSVVEPKKSRRKALKKLDKHISAAFESLPTGTLFLLLLPGTASQSSAESACNGLLLVGTTEGRS